MLAISTKRYAHTAIQMCTLTTLIELPKKCLTARFWTVDEVWQDVLSRGSGWVRRVRRGLAALNRIEPQLDVLQWLRLPQPD